MQSYGQTFLKAYMSTSHTYLEMKPIQFKFHWTKGPSYSSGWQNGLKNQSKIQKALQQLKLEREIIFYSSKKPLCNNLQSKRQRLHELFALHNCHPLRTTLPALVNIPIFLAISNHMVAL